MKKEKQQGKEHRTTQKDSARSMDIQKHARGISSPLISHNPTRNVLDCDNDEKETNCYSRELVLPRDSNVVKGNV